MEISFRNRKLEKLANDYNYARKKLGVVQANRLSRRLDDLAAAANLEMVRQVHRRFHELKGDLKGTFSLDLEHPYRLLIVPQVSPPPTKPDGGIDLSAIEAVEIIAIADTHA